MFCVVVVTRTPTVVTSSTMAVSDPVKEAGVFVVNLLVKFQSASNFVLVSI